MIPADRATAAVVVRNRRARQLPTALARPMRDGYVVASVIYLAALAAGILPHAAADTHIYWTNTLPDPYTIGSYAAGNGFFYAPPFAQAFWPLTWLPFATVAVAWAFLLLTVLWLLVGAWAPLALLFVPVAVEIYFGNVNLLLAAVAVWGLRWKWLWAFPLFTKVTPAIGVVWFVARREWRSAATAVVIAGVIGLGSLLVGPNLWKAWVQLLVSNVESAGGWEIGPLWARLCIAVAVVGWGGVTGRTWAIPVGMLISMPRLWLASFAVLIAIPALADVEPAPVHAPQTRAQAGSRST